MTMLSKKLTLLLLLLLPLIASQATSAQEAASPANSESPAKVAKKGASSILGVMTGLTVGIPISVVRSIGVETKRMKAQVADDTAGADRPDLFAHLAGSTMGLLYGVPSGFIKGSIQGAERGITLGAEKPFSADSLSLGDLQMEYKANKQSPEQP